MNRPNKKIGSMQNSQLLRTIAMLIGMTLLYSFTGCDKSDEVNLTADFTYEFKDDNHVVFTNTSVGDYYSMLWDFGNNQADTTIDKKETFQVYYPTAADYEVSLKILDYTGNTANVKKTISISKTELLVAFTAVPNPSNPNYIVLTNTSIGDYDSFRWVYRDTEVENEMEYMAYFPFKGAYDVELILTKAEQEFSHVESLNIAQNDPDYIPNLTLVWSDEFDGDNVNASDWTFETGASGWGNNELQNYTNGNNADVVDGKLIITARKINDNTTVGSYTSTRIITKGKQEFQYGQIEIRAKLPSGTGIWPAIWMLGSNFSSAGWPACGEIDIMEYVGYQPNVVHATVHTTSGSGGNGNGSSKSLPSCEEEFHVYGLLWTENELTFYIDVPTNITHVYAPPVKTAANWPFNQKAFFILNVAVGGNWGGAQGIDNSIFPQTMEVDYVRVYQEVR